MDILEIFQGKRLVKEFNVFTKSKGKVRLDCKIEEEWRQKYSETSSCGIPIKHSTKRTVGVSITERENLESTVSSKLGLKDVWEISSAIKGSIGYELRLDETVEEAKELETPTPQCGRLTVKVFQLHRLYTFTFKDERFLRRKKSTHPMVEKLNDWWNHPDTLDPAPECKCKTEGEIGIRKRIGIAFKNFGLHLECLQTTEALIMPSLGLTFPGKKLEDLIGEGITVGKEKLPAHILFLAGESSSSLTGVIVQYRKVPTEELVSGSEKRAVIVGVGLSILAGVSLALLRLGRRRAGREEFRGNEEVTPPEEVAREATSRLKAIQHVGASEERSDEERGGPVAHA